MTLYELNEAILGCVDAETGEVIDFEQLDKLTMEKDAKIEGIALWVKSLEAEAEAISREVDALSNRKKVKENKAKRLREYLGDALGGNAFETPRVKMTFRKSYGLRVTDENLLMKYLEQNHKDCISYKAPTVSKSAVTALIKMGEAVPGAVVEQKNNLQLK